MGGYRICNAAYFSTMGIPLIRGRFFTEQDVATTERVVILNHRLARRYWPGADPIGQRLKPGRPDAKNPWYKIVGIVGDVRHQGLETEPMPELYFPYLQTPESQNTVAITRYATLILRTAADPSSLAGVLRREVLAVDSDQPAAYIMTMEQMIAESLTYQRLSMILLGLFAALALLLGAIGLHGVIAYLVTLRQREIGIRMALGAQKTDILKLVVREGLVLALIGVAIGLAGAYGLTRAMSSLLFSVSPTDSAIFFGIALLLMGVALLACYIPARRATKIDPMIAIRYQ
jgi:putative ABC transport system permease protein